PPPARHPSPRHGRVGGGAALSRALPDDADRHVYLFDDDRRIFTSICNGASGYVLKKTPPARLLEALRAARDGGAPMSPEIARRVVEVFRRMRPRELAAPLTPTEVRLLGHLAEGLSYQSAAEKMGI